MPDRIRASVSFKVQVFQYEPVEVGGFFETDVHPGETTELAYKRAFDVVSQQCADKLREVANQLRSLRATGV